MIAGAICRSFVLVEMFPASPDDGLPMLMMNIQKLGVGRSFDTETDV